MQQAFFEPEKNPAELGRTCGQCARYWRERFVPWSPASCGRCEIHKRLRIKAKSPACVSFTPKT